MAVAMWPWVGLCVGLWGVEGAGGGGTLQSVGGGRLYGSYWNMAATPDSAAPANSANPNRRSSNGYSYYNQVH